MTRRNPFTINPIIQKKEFIGRENLISEVREILRTRQNCWIVGERKSGKTSFLYRMAEEFEEREDVKFVLLDLQQLRSCEPEEILGRIAQQIDADFSEDKIGYNRFEDFIRDKRVVLALDEISVLLKSKMIDSEFFLFLRYILDKFDLTLLTTHRRDINETSNVNSEELSPFFRIFRRIHLGYLSKEESKKLILKGGEEFFNRHEKWIIERTYYHPFLLQLLCSLLFDSGEEEEKDEESMFISTEKEAFKVLETFLESLYEESLEDEKRILWEIFSMEGKMSRDEKGIVQRLERRLLIYKSNDRCHLVSPFLKKSMKLESQERDHLRILLKEITSIFDYMILPEGLPSEFKAKQRREYISKFIRDTKHFRESEGYCIGEFITFDRYLQRELNWVLEDIIAYVIRSSIEDTHRPLNIFIQAPPGSGKSFLVKSFCEEIAKRQKKHKYELPFLEINLASISSYSELIMFLDSVVQESIYKKIPFVLFDEIDAAMPGFSFYQRMLMPMWDGAYLKEGQYKKLPSTIFFYAGTPEGLRSKAKSNRFRISCFLKNILHRFRRLIVFSKAEQILYHKEISIECSRESWREECQNELRNLAENAAIPKLLDFYERLDRFIFMPPMTSYFKDLDDDPELYFGDREMIHFFVTKIRKTFLDVKGKPRVSRISRAALAFLCSRFYRSRRAMGRAIFLSRVDSDSDIYSLESLPKELSPSKGEELKLKCEYPGEITIQDLE